MKACESIALAHCDHRCRYFPKNAKGSHRTSMNKAYRTILFAIILLLTSAAAWASEPQFAIKESHKDSNGVTLKTAAGTMRDRSLRRPHYPRGGQPDGEIPAPKVPVVLQPCRADNVVVKIGKKDVTLSTAGVTVSVNATTGAVSFLSRDGKAVLAEPEDGGKSFDVPSLAEMKTWQIQQTFVSPSDEFQYGLGPASGRHLQRSRSTHPPAPGEHQHFRSVPAVEQRIRPALEQSVA